MLFVLHLSKTVLVLMASSSSLSAHLMVLSTSFLAQGRPSTITSDCSTTRLRIPHRYLNLPCGRKKVVMSELFGSIASWKYPCT